jgi:hypothetical protein
LSLALLLALAPGAQAWAQRGGRPGDFARGGPHQHLDGRFAHNQFYFNRGYSVRSLPPGGGRLVRARDGSQWWYGSGNWYRWRGGSWSVGGAPRGVFVPVLPPLYSTVWSGGIPYYYANDTYYTWDVTQQGYAVVAPPAGIESHGTTQPPGSNQLFVYPKKGQSEEQQSTDRFECHRWAVEQSGFDPTVTGGGVPAGQASEQRDRYFRAEMACLEARGYAVE